MEQKRTNLTMKNSELISIETLQSMFFYDCSTGSIKWRSSKRGVAAGTEFGSIKPCSKTTYMVGKVFKIRIFAHHLAWVLHYGEWPKHQIDHINHDGLDNRIENLRDVPQSVNNRNASLRKDSTSGHVGVSWDSSQGKWVAQININRRRVYLGSFSNITEAIDARQKANIENGYHKNHGVIVER